VGSGGPARLTFVIRAWSAIRRVPNVRHGACVSRQAAYSFAEASRRYSAGQLRFTARAAPRTEIIRVREGQPIRRCRSIRGPIPLAMGTPTGPLLATLGRESLLMTVRSRGCAWRSSRKRAVRPTSVG
jgi:hypothetical protein